MAEPPAKRVRRTDSAAMWDKDGSTTAPKAQRPSEDLRDTKRKDSERDTLNGVKDRRRNEAGRDEGRRRSRSRDQYQGRRERSRSRDRPAKDKDRDRDGDRVREGRRDRDRERDRVHRGSRRERERSRSPDRHRSSKDTRVDRDRDRTRHRSRSRSPVRNGTSTSTRTRSPPKAPQSDRGRPSTPATTRSTAPIPPSSKPKRESAPEDIMQIDSKTNGHKGADEDEDSEDALLRKMMGFSTFKTTQNKKIPGNDVFGVRKEKSTNYRQYMNRNGGFNRPLSPSRE